MSLRLLLAGIIGLLVLAYNTNVVGDLRNNFVAPFKAWQKDPDHLKAPITLNSPKFPDRSREGIGKTTFKDPDAKQIHTPGGTVKEIAGRKVRIPGLPGNAKQDTTGTPFGARAVGVQRAKGL